VGGFEVLKECREYNKRVRDQEMDEHLTRVLSADQMKITDHGNGWETIVYTWDNGRPSPFRTRPYER
jgi:hypothetical protein